MTCLDPRRRAKMAGRIRRARVLQRFAHRRGWQIYCISEGGTVVVLSAGDEFKIISQFKMEDEATDFDLGGGASGISSTRSSAPILSSIAVARGQLYVRTPVHLYCIAIKP